MMDVVEFRRPVARGFVRRLAVVWWMKPPQGLKINKTNNKKKKNRKEREKSTRVTQQHEDRQRRVCTTVSVSYLRIAKTTPTTRGIDFYSSDPGTFAPFSSKRSQRLSGYKYKECYKNPSRNLLRKPDDAIFTPLSKQSGHNIRHGQNGSDTAYQAGDYLLLIFPKYLMNFMKICSSSHVYLRSLFTAVISAQWFTTQVSGVRCNSVYSNTFPLYPVKPLLNPVDQLGPVIRRGAVPNPRGFITPRRTYQPALMHSTVQPRELQITHPHHKNTHDHRANVILHTAVCRDGGQVVTCLEEGCEHVRAGSGDGGPPLDHTREI